MTGIISKVTNKDFRNFYKHQFLFDKFSIKNFFIVLIAFLFLGIMIDDIKKTGFIFFFFKYSFVGAILYFIYLLLNYLESRNKSKPIYGNLIFSIVEGGINIENNNLITLRNWVTIQEISICNNYVYIILTDNTTYLINLNSFESESQILNFISEVNAEIIKLRGTLVVQKKSNPPFWVGIFGIIPIIGAFVGIVIILIGVFKYKSKWFTIIGILCVLFSVFLYWDLVYKMNNKEELNKGFTPISINQLNSLVQQIEFYKISNGEYPENLQQIPSDGILGYTDVIQSVNKRKNIDYEYQKIGEKYKLYSRGVDGIAKTKDDIFPTIKIDTTKVGLIIERK